MKTNTKKTISAALALILASAILTTGCGKAEDADASAADTSYSEESFYSEEASAETEEAIISAALTRAELEAKNTWNETQISEVSPLGPVSLIRQHLDNPHPGVLLFEL